MSGYGYAFINIQRLSCSVHAALTMTKATIMHFSRSLPVTLEPKCQGISGLAKFVQVDGGLRHVVAGIGLEVNGKKCLQMEWEKMAKKKEKEVETINRWQGKHLPEACFALARLQF